MPNQLLLRTLALSITLGAAGTAQAAEMIIEDKGTHERAMHADVFAVINPSFYGYLHLGLGGWFAYPVVPDGFIPDLNEAFFIEAGAAVERYSWSWGAFGYDCSESWWRVTPMGGVRWSFYLTPEWTVFGTAKLGWGLGFADGYSCGGNQGRIAGGASISGISLDGGIGAYWNFSPDWSARLDLGYFGLSAGAGTDLGGIK
jgi:hypothetical protein